MSWQQQLKEENKFYREKISQLEYKEKEHAQIRLLLEKIVLGPPTLMIACEKLVEAAAQITTTANEVCKRGLETARERR